MGTASLLPAQAAVQNVTTTLLMMIYCLLLPRGMAPPAHRKGHKGVQPHHKSRLSGRVGLLLTGTRIRIYRYQLSRNCLRPILVSISTCLSIMSSRRLYDKYSGSLEPQSVTPSLMGPAYSLNPARVPRVHQLCIQSQALQYLLCKKARVK